MGTSQSAIARIEAGEENITLGTLERIIKALNGRLAVSIQPAELPFIRSAPWWERVPSTTAWTAKFIAMHRGGKHAIVGYECDVTSPSPLLVATAQTSKGRP
jgi:helix-turn-helix protein